MRAESSLSDVERSRAGSNVDAERPRAGSNVSAERPRAGSKTRVERSRLGAQVVPPKRKAGEIQIQEQSYVRVIKAFPAQIQIGTVGQVQRVDHRYKDSYFVVFDTEIGDEGVWVYEDEIEL